MQDDCEKLMEYLVRQNMANKKNITIWTLKKKSTFIIMG